MAKSSKARRLWAVSLPFLFLNLLTILWQYYNFMENNTNNEHFHVNEWCGCNNIPYENQM